MLTMADKGGGGVWQMLNLADKEGRGVLTNANRTDNFFLKGKHIFLILSQLKVRKCWPVIVFSCNFVKRVAERGEVEIVTRKQNSWWLPGDGCECQLSLRFCVIIIVYKKTRLCIILSCYHFIVLTVVIHIHFTSLSILLFFAVLFFLLVYLYSGFFFLVLLVLLVLLVITVFF